MSEYGALVAEHVHRLFLARAAEMESLCAEAIWATDDAHLGDLVIIEDGWPDRGPLHDRRSVGCLLWSVR